MILQSLNQFYERLESGSGPILAPFGFSHQKISFCVVLDFGGTPIAIEDIRVLSGEHRVPPSLVVPGQAKSSGPGINPGFLWDNQSYLLGYSPNTKGAKRDEESFEAFRQMHLAAEAGVSDAGFSTVCRFLESWCATDSQKFAVLATLPASFGVFRIAGESQYIHDREAVSSWWKRQLLSDGGSDKNAMGQCLVTGQIGPIVRLHTPKIKGVWGAQSSGAAIVAFSRTAFESYGKHQSLNAPVSEQVAFKYCTALNHLLRIESRQRADWQFVCSVLVERGQ